MYDEYVECVRTHIGMSLYDEYVEYVQRICLSYIMCFFRQSSFFLNQVEHINTKHTQKKLTKYRYLSRIYQEFSLFWNRK